MTTKIATSALNLQNALTFVANATNANVTLYVTACRPTAVANDSVIPTVNTSVGYLSYGVFDEMVFGKRLEPADVSVMIRKNEWEANTIFDHYDHREDQSNANFYTTVSTNTGIEVFKCIWNNNGAASNVAPSAASTDATEAFYETADGYKWKWLFSVDQTTVDKFQFENYAPCVPNANVTGGAANGAVFHFIVDAGGSRYNSYHSGFITEPAVGGNTLIHAIESSASANTDFYKNCAIKLVSGTGAGQQSVVTEYIVSGSQKRVLIDQEFNPLPDNTTEYEITPRVVVTGDGSNLIARALVNATTNSIHSVEITNFGQGYSWVNAYVIGNTGIVTNNVAVAANNAQITAIISPPGGHGANVYSELFAENVGISLKFANNEGSTISTANDFRTWALLKNPRFSNVALGVANVSGTFTANEPITQANTNASGTLSFTSVGEIRLTNATGRFATGNSTVNVIRGTTSNVTATVTSLAINGVAKNFATFDQRTRMDITSLNAFTFQEDEVVEESETLATGAVHEANSTFLALTGVRGTFNSSDLNTTYQVSADVSGASADVGTVIGPDCHRYIGEVLYIENILPVSRNDNQSETLRLVLKF